MSLLSERAMITCLHISSWSTSTVDREATDEVHTNNRAEKEAGRYSKRLVAPRFLSDIAGADAAARTANRVLTLPWEENGARILSNTAYFAYHEKMQACKRKWQSAVKAFLSPEVRQLYLTEAEKRLGKMFDVNDYPSVDEIASRYNFDVEIKPMPESSDFRAQLNDEQTKGIIKDIERRTNERLEKAMNDVFSRVQDVVGRMSERLREYQPAKDGQRAEGTIRDSVISSVYELATEVLPALNITGDQRITELQQHLLDDLTEHSPEILRADAKARASTVSKADKLLKKVQSYMK